MTVPSHVKQQQQIYVNFHRQTHPLLSLFIILVNFAQNVSYADYSRTFTNGHFFLSRRTVHTLTLL